MSLFDTLSTENKSEEMSSENYVQEKTEPSFASSEKNWWKHSENSNLSFNEKEN